MGDNILIHNALLWASVDTPPIAGGSVLVTGDRIRRVGVFDCTADRRIDAGGCLLMPGLVQGHVHLCQTIFRGIAEDLALLPWLRTYIWPMEAAHDEASIRASALLTMAEMIRGGTTTFMSMETVRHTGVACDVVDETGMMGIVGHCLMDKSGGYDPLAVDIDDGLATCDRLLDRWRTHDRVRIAVAPRFALSCTGENLKRAADFARANDLMLHTHSSEQEEEVKLVRERTGKDNIDYLASVGLSGSDVGLAHCVHTKPHERERLRNAGTRVLHCPSANLKLASGIAPIPEYLAAGILVAIGADGAPCNNRMDNFLEMREAALIQKPRLGPDALSAKDVVRMATSMGAEVLNWESEIGTLEEGKRANLILVRQDTVHVEPSRDPATNLVYGNAAADVRLTMVNGKILYQDGKLLTIDEDELIATVREERRKLEQRALGGSDR